MIRKLICSDQVPGGCRGRPEAWLVPIGAASVSLPRDTVLGERCRVISFWLMAGTVNGHCGLVAQLVRAHA